MSLVKNGFNVSHICPDKDGDRVIDGVRVITYTGKRSIAGRLAQLGLIYKRAKQENADVYHCNEVDSWMVGVALKIATRKKIVFDSHEIPSHDFAETRFPRPLRPFVVLALRVLFRLMLPFTDRLVLAKRSADLDFRNTAVNKTLVQNFSEVPENIPQKIHTDGHDITIVHLGAINKMRGWKQMLDALALTKNTSVRLRVIGQFGDNSEDEFLAYVKEKQLEHRVVFERWIPYSEVQKALGACDIGIILFQPVMYSFTHALPHKMFDYMLAGLPIIVPDFAVEVAEITNESKAGILVSPTDPQKVADVIDTLASSADLRNEYGSNGRNAVIATYNWGQEEKRLVAMYESLKGNASCQAR